MNAQSENGKEVYIDEKSLGDIVTEDYDSEDNSNQVFIKSPEEKAFVKKLNWTLLPLVFLITFIQVRLK